MERSFKLGIATCVLVPAAGMASTTVAHASSHQAVAAASSTSRPSISSVSFSGYYGHGSPAVPAENGPTGQESRSARHRAATSVNAMTSLETLTLEVADPAAADRFYSTAFGLGAQQLQLRASNAPSTGFRGFVLSLTVSQPSIVNGLVGAALGAGATPLKPAAKSFWGYGGVVQAPDGAIWKIATSAKKDTGPDSRQIDQMVILLGAADVAATKRFYVDQGLAVAKSYGRKYVEFAAGEGPVKLALYGRRALAKDVDVPIDGTGSHRIVLGSDAGSFTDPDGFAWEPAPAPSTP